MAIPLEEAFGQVVRARRQRAKLSQEALAQAADLSTVYISEIEGGKRRPSIRVLVQIAEGLDVSPGRLIDQAVELADTR